MDMFPHKIHFLHFGDAYLKAGKRRSCHIYIYILPETNIAPKNGGFQYQSPFPGVYFQGRTVSFREGRGIVLFTSP